VAFHSGKLGTFEQSTISARTEFVP
jgi:hypothetical protein